MSVTTADFKIALRDYLRAHSDVTAIVSVNRIVTSLQDVKEPGNWCVIERRGGPVDLYTPMRTPRIHLSCYGANRWEAIRLIEAVSHVLGLDDPHNMPRIEGTGVVISSMRPESDIQGDIDDLVPGIEKRIPLAFRAIILNVHRAD